MPWEWPPGPQEGHRRVTLTKDSASAEPVPAGLVLFKTSALLSKRLPLLCENRTWPRSDRLRLPPGHKTLSFTSHWAGGAVGKFSKCTWNAAWIIKGERTLNYNRDVPRTEKEEIPTLTSTEKAFPSLFTGAVDTWIQKNFEEAWHKIKESFLKIYFKCFIDKSFLYWFWSFSIIGTGIIVVSWNIKWT